MSEARPPRRPPLTGRLLSAGARAGDRLASATGIDQAVEGATEEAIVRALESPAVERAIVRVLESDAAQDAFERTLSSPAVERAAVKVLDSELVDRVWDQLLASDEVQKLIERIAEAPELRQAIAAQGVGFLGDIGRRLRGITERLDHALERVVRRLIGKPRTEPTRNLGILTRGLAFVIDLALLNGALLLTAAVLASIFGTGGGVSTAGFVAGLGTWIIATSTYLFLFWSLAGQTPGMRVLSIRIEADGSPELGPRIARRRLGGTILATIPFGLGFIGILLRDDRCGLPDRRAGTVVVPFDPVAPYSQPHAPE
jgi:uncharacterized RDD family membrane protein YckC